MSASGYPNGGLAGVPRCEGAVWRGGFPCVNMYRYLERQGKDRYHPSVIELPTRRVTCS
jgi:hypothetical protein